MMKLESAIFRRVFGMVTIPLSFRGIILGIVAGSFLVSVVFEKAVTIYLIRREDRAAKRDQRQREEETKLDDLLAVESQL
jgi:hypothetical protein